MLSNKTYFAVLLSRSYKHAVIREKRLYSNIGFVGLGNMGAHMARNLLKKNYNLTVFDVNQTAMARLAEVGAKTVNNAADISPNVEVVISMLPSNENVLECYLGEKGILRSIKKNSLLIDSSTVDPSVSQSVAKEAEKKGVSFIDSPVSGGVNAARDGTLTFMVGGLKTNFDNAKPILEAMGSRIVYCGEVGAGEIAKLCNNMLLAISMIGTAEAFNLGRKLGLDLKILAEIVNSSSGRCWSSELYNPVPGILPNVPSSNDYEGGFGTALIAKDLGLAQLAATRTNTPIPLGAIAHQLYRTAMVHGLANKDFGVIYKFLKDEN